MSLGLLWIGHGTRNPQGLAEFEEFTNHLEHEVSRRMALQRDTTLRFGRSFIELQEPDIEDAIHSLVRAGATRICCVPLLLFSAGHLQVDIPASVERAQVLHHGVQVDVMEAVGVDSDFVRATTERLFTAGYGDDSVGQHVIFVGRGNREATAQAAFEAIGQEVSKLAGEPRIYTSYLAGTGTSLEASLDHCIGERELRADDIIYVLPYLWFQGWLTKTLPDRIARWQKQSGWAGTVIIAKHLGVDPRLVIRMATRVVERLNAQSE